ncbi:MAG: ice-binding family protein [Candidatus Doudnabacteria bacterium]
MAVALAVLVLPILFGLARLIPAEAAFQPPAFLNVIKHVINDNGGTAVASDFTMTVNGVIGTPTTFPGVESPGVLVTIQDDSFYSVIETGPSSYTATFSADCTGTLSPFETKTCTVTNDDIPPTLPPSLGAAATFRVLTGTLANAAPGTIINGNLGYTVPPAMSPVVNGTTYVAPDPVYLQAGADQAAALAILNDQPCDFNFGAATVLSALPQPLEPGVYCITGAASVGAPGITIRGSGQYLFRMVGALNTTAASSVTFSPGATVCDVFWTPTGATTLGANSTFAGTVIGTAITVGNQVTWNGRALAFGGTVTTAADTFNPSSCPGTPPPTTGTLVVTKTTSGVDGTFNFTSNIPGNTSFVITTTANSGTKTFSAVMPGTYSITETPQAGWTQNSSTCSSVSVVAGSQATCTVANSLVVQVPPAFSLSLNKSANPITYSAAGQTIVYTYALTDNGNMPLTGPFTINDDKLGTFTCGSIATIILPGATFTCTKNYVTQASDLGSVTNWIQGVTANINTGAWLGFANSSQDTAITGAGANVPDSTYKCWCIQDGVPTDLHNQSAHLYSTTAGSLPADVAVLAWNKVNYTLNHKIRGAGKSDLDFVKDVQTAIWALVGDPSPQFGISTAAQQMINDANAHASYVPGPTDVTALIIYTDGINAIIRPGEVQESICEINANLKSIVNKAIGSMVVTSGQAQFTVNQVR